MQQPAPPSNAAPRDLSALPGEPPDFDPAEANRILGRGETPPGPWLPFLTEVKPHDGDVADLRPLTMLPNLRSLVVRHGTRVDLTPLAGLTGLQTLDLTATQVSGVTPLAHLKGLTILR